MVWLLLWLQLSMRPMRLEEGASRDDQARCGANHEQKMNMSLLIGIVAPRTTGWLVFPVQKFDVSSCSSVVMLTAATMQRQSKISI